MAAANGRLQKEIAACSKDDSSGVRADPIGDNLRQLKGKLKGPQGTVYEGGVFEVDIRIPNQYPFEPPKMKFITKVWHPNVSSQTGAICLVSPSIASIFVVCITKHDSCSFFFDVGYFERSMESCSNHKDSLTVATSVTLFARTRRSTGCSGGSNVYG